MAHILEEDSLGEDSLEGNPEEGNPAVDIVAVGTHHTAVAAHTVVDTVAVAHLNSTRQLSPEASQRNPSSVRVEAIPAANKTAWEYFDNPAEHSRAHHWSCPRERLLPLADDGRARHRSRC